MGLKKTPITTNEILKPEKILSNMINDYIKGVFDAYSFLYRVLVVKVDKVGGQLEGKNATNTSRQLGVSNPKNSIMGRIITDGVGRATPEEDLPVFWPLFPYDEMPIKEGEHAYVIFEDNINNTHRIMVNKNT